MADNNSNNEICLLVLARILADEIRPINYADEWLKEPLNHVLHCLYDVLNLHSQQLGTILSEAFAQTVPTLKPGNVNFLASSYPDYFGKTKQYFLDLFYVEQIIKNTTVTNINLSNDLRDATENKPKTALAELALSILDAFVGLTEAAENQHRTLERICHALTPVYYTYGLTGVGFDLTEYADQWRHLTATDRVNLRDDIKSRWL